MPGHGDCSIAFGVLRWVSPVITNVGVRNGLRAGYEPTKSRGSAGIKSQVHAHDDEADRSDRGCR